MFTPQLSPMNKVIPTVPLVFTWLKVSCLSTFFPPPKIKSETKLRLYQTVVCPSSRLFRFAIHKRPSKTEPRRFMFQWLKAFCVSNASETLCSLRPPPSSLFRRGEECGPIESERERPSLTISGWFGTEELSITKWTAISTLKSQLNREKQLYSVVLSL